MSDSSLQFAVVEALAHDPHVHADEIAVQVVEGRVALRGTVGSPLQSGWAMQTAWAVPGVRDVSDELHVRVLDGAGRADADTDAAVLDALVADEQLHALRFDVQSRDGCVTLRGLVRSADQRDRAEWVALAVPGVSEVHNRLHL